MIESTEKRLELQIPKWVEQDTWVPVRSFVRVGGYNGIAQGSATIVSPLAPGRRNLGGSNGDGESAGITGTKTEVNATRSIIMVGKALFDYTDNLMPLADPSLTRAIGQSLQSFIGKVFGEYEVAVAGASEEHGLAIVLDAIVLTEYVVPKIVARMDHALGCTVGETRLLLGFAQAQNEALLRKFGRAAALRYVNSTIGWSGTDYSELLKDAEGGVKAPRKVFDDFVDQAQALIAMLAAAAPRSPYVSVVAKTIVNECAAELENERSGFWINVASQGITRLGFQQLTLDLKYFAHLCEKLMSRQAGDLIKDMIKRAKKHRKKSSGGHVL